MSKQMKLSGWFKSLTPTNNAINPASTSQIELQHDMSSDEEQPPAPAATQKKSKTRKFVTSWEVKYPGVFERDGKLYCKACTTYTTISDPSSTLVQGTGSYRTAGLDKHWTSKQHERAVSRYNEVEAERTGRPVDGPMNRAIRQLNAANYEILVKLLNTAYYVLINEEPFTSLPHLLELQIKNSSDLQRLTSYKSDQACRRLTPYIADTIRQSIVTSLRNSTAISILFDGATDNSVQEVEVVYARYVNNGEPKTVFFSLQPVKHAHAQRIYEAIEQAFVDNRIDDWKEKLVGMACDGAAVNLSRKNSVATRVKENAECVISVHCVAHRLELAVLQAIKNNRYLEDLKEILKLIYKHYQYSPKALREVTNIAMALETKVLKPNRVDGTRWSPHMQRALEVLATSYEVLLAHFEHVAEARPGETTADIRGRAVFLRNRLKDYTIVRFPHFLRDLLDVIGNLSLVFQKDSLTVNGMLDALETAHLQLTALKQSPGSKLAEFTAALQRDPSGCKATYREVELKNVQMDDSNTYIDVIETVMQHMNNRFDSEADVSTPILRAARVFDIKEGPQEKAQLATYGDCDIKRLWRHFQPVLQRQKPTNEETLLAEWIQLKAFIANAGWRAISSVCYGGHQERFAHILMLHDVVLTLPVSSATCERGFSCLSRIKTDWRSSLRVDMMDKLMLVSLEGPTIQDFNAEGPLDLWWESAQRSRRPRFQERTDEQASSDLLESFLIL
ncbi:zinc finger protein 862-like [Diretmus argenteus]